MKETGKFTIHNINWYFDSWSFESWGYLGLCFFLSLSLFCANLNDFQRQTWNASGKGKIEEKIWQKVNGAKREEEGKKVREDEQDEDGRRWWIRKFVKPKIFRLLLFRNFCLLSSFRPSGYSQHPVTNLNINDKYHSNDMIIFFSSLLFKI